MQTLSVSRASSKPIFGFVVGLLLLLCSSQLLMGQATVGTGAIQGIITDPTGAVVSGAKVSINNKNTGQSISATTNSSGSFTSGALAPGDYVVRVEASGFKTSEIPVAVQVGGSSSANLKLEIGQSNVTVEVQANTLAVNTEQAEVSGVLTSAQIENLPVNGRNFLDLAQLEPGVQIQDGQNFDPTKAGYSSISFGGRFGRTARINVDGIDISDETVGTSTEDIPASAIDQFQLGQSSLDLSNDLTSSGAVNVTTKSGGNSYHGEAFGLFRDRSIGGASTPGGGALPFQRSQFGGNFGGALIKDKLFFFADGERIKQDSFAPLQFAVPFDVLNGGFSVPFRDTELFGRVDYNLGHNARLFYRYTYFANSLPSDFALGYSVYSNKDYTRQNAVGADFNTGSYTHTVRFSYLKFQNQIVDTTTGSNLPFANLGVTLRAGSFWTGPSPLAPQSTPQANKEIKYDGSHPFHSHIFRYGASLNHIQGGGFASFYGSAPRISWTENAAARLFANNDGPNPGGETNPLNYPAQSIRFGNGQGFNTLQPALGFPAGGLGPDNRIGLYVGDSWKVKSNFTLSLGLRYDRDSGRTDSDLPADAAINGQFPGQGNRVKQANLNFAPQLGIAWDPSKDGKTVIRGGIGLYYDNVIYNNVLFDRPLRLQTGAFNQTPFACTNGQPGPLQITGGALLPIPAGFCTDPAKVTATNPLGYNAVSDAIASVIGLQQQYKAGNPFSLTGDNPNYIGNSIAQGASFPVGLFDPNYKTSRSLQINFGVQRQIRQGMIFSADFLRNVGTHSLLGIDVNHVGDVKNFNLANAQAAIATTNAAFGCATVDCVISQITPTGGPSIVDYANNGLTSDFDFGQACIQAIGVDCAFGGKNSTQGVAPFLKPIGRSVYNALQMKLVQNQSHPFRGVRNINFQVSYSLSQYKNSGGAVATGQAADNDQDFVLAAADNNSPNRYFGQSLLDRKHQLSFGGYVDVPFHFRVGLLAHFYSPLSSGIFMPPVGGGGEIFQTDFTGDGTTGDPLPGTKFGQFDRATNAGGLTALVNNYYQKQGFQPTPAGQVLITNGLMTLAQLQALGGVAPGDPSTATSINEPTLAPPVAGQADFTWLKTADVNIAWSYKIKERFTIEPSVAFFNLFNFANFNLPPNTLTGLLGTTGSISTMTVADNKAAFRAGNGTGVYALGAGRQIEWGLKFTF